MATPPIPKTEIERAAALYRAAVAAGAVPVGAHVGTGKESAVTAVMRETGWSIRQAKGRIAAALRVDPANEPSRTAWDASSAFTTDPLPSAAMPVEDLIASRITAFEREKVARAARELIPVRVNIEGPYGILHMGDPHVDDGGCDWGTLQSHINLANRTEGLFAANVGDLANNWIGRLARLHANQSVTATDAVRLVEWLIKSVPWLYLVGGNHDAWSGANDPIRWLSAQAGALYEMHGMRLALRQPDGSEVRVNARHDFKGHSMWNGTHAVMKAAKFAWQRDHIYVCGHRHSAAYANVVFQNGQHIAHAIRLGAYKVYDDYADANDFLPENIPAAVTVINPNPRTPAGRVSFFWDVEEGADFLRFLRRPRVRIQAKGVAA